MSDTSSNPGHEAFRLVFADESGTQLRSGEGITDTLESVYDAIHRRPVVGVRVPHLVDKTVQETKPIIPL